MGNSVECCSTRQRVCDINDSVFGEDAYYRDARWDDFHDCYEGTAEHDNLFSRASEQAWLKISKGTLAASYATFELQRRARPVLEDSGASSSSIPAPVRVSSSRDLGRTNRWLGRTMQQWLRPELPPTGDGPYWAPGDGTGLMVRQGPNYMKNRNKGESQGSMYKCISCDAIKGDDKVEDIVGRLIDVSELPSQSSLGESDRGAGPSAGALWSPDCPLPRVLCLNLMLPYETGLVPWRADAGASFVAIFHIKPDTIRAAASKTPPPGVRALIDFCRGPAGLPGGRKDDPNRCLASRLDPSKKKDAQSGIFKANAKCLNPTDVNVPEILHEYNGKPCLITKSGYIIKDPKNEWLEIGIDVRGFNVLVRKMLSSYRSMIPKTKIHFGFLVQGCLDDELPEELLCDVCVYGVDIMDDPAVISS